MTKKKKDRCLINYMVAGIAILSIGCLTLAYLWIDRSISFAYLDSSYRATEQAYTLVSTLLEREWLDLSEHEILRKLQAEAKRQPQNKILVKRGAAENVIWFDNIRFEFQSGRLARVY